MQKLTYAVATFSALLAAVPAQSKTVTATAANFTSVYNTLVGGDKLVLSGTFAGVSVSNKAFASKVTIDARAATFTSLVRVMNVNNITWMGGKFLIPDTDVNYTKAITVSTATNIVFTGLSIVGHDTGQGVQIGSGKNISILNSRFERLRVGVAMQGVTGGTISGNISRASSNDGFDIADSHKIKVTHNTCSGTAPSVGAHADCVQLWSIKGNVPNSDIMIADNTATGATQGFTSFNGSAGGGDRISFLRNRVDTSYPQGIACYECRDSNISNNVVTTQSGAQFRTSINVVGGARNTVAGNTVGAKPITGANSVVADDAAFDRADFTDISTVNLDPTRAVTGGGIGIAAAVPEPQTWATMLAGFALAGAAMRRRRIAVVTG